MTMPLRQREAKLPQCGRKPRRSHRALDLAAIRQNNPLPEIAGAVVALKRSRREWIGCCPFHQDRTPSFTIYDDGQRFWCFGYGASGDVFDFVQRFHGVRFLEAAHMLGSREIASSPFPRPIPAQQPDRAQIARVIWQRTISAAGTLAETYLRSRGLEMPIPPDIRFAYLNCDDLGALPCLVAAVREVSGNIVGIQRIWLADDGMGKADVANPKRSLGHIKGGAIRLAELEGSGIATVCEGAEDGLSLLTMLNTPVWVAVGATFMSSMQFPPQVQSINIGADNDTAGEVEAQKAALAFAARGLAVRIVRPLADFKDFNDELRGSH